MTKVIKLSDNAADRIKEIMSNAEATTIGVRVGVQSGGCAGMSYVMEYAKEIMPNEEGTEMNYKKEKFSSQFVFKNPNETERCGCGESFKV